MQLAFTRAPARERRPKAINSLSPIPLAVRARFALALADVCCALATDCAACAESTNGRTSLRRPCPCSRSANGASGAPKRGLTTPFEKRRLADEVRIDGATQGLADRMTAIRTALAVAVIVPAGTRTWLAARKEQGPS